MTDVKYPKDFSEFKLGETYPTLKAENSATNSSAALSFISIRQTHAEYISTPFSFLITDETALLFRPHANEYNAIVNYDTRHDCRHHLEFFNEVWQRSEPVSEIRQLFI